MITKNRSRLPFALRYAGVHFTITLTVAILVGILVFGLWYPEPFRQMTGGLGLYKLILGVDVVCGPMLTLILASPKKSHKAMLIDITLIACIQLSALGYGLYNVAEARPVAIVAELDRFRVISLLDIYNKDRDQALPEYRHTPLWGIQTVGVERGTTSETVNKNLELSLKGIEMGMRPDLWRPYTKMKNSLKKAVRPLSALKNLTDKEKKQLNKTIQSIGINRKVLAYLPITAPMSDNWIALLDKQNNLVGYANINGW